MIPALALFLVSFAYYLHGLSPALNGGDSGEFIASSFTLGLPHAPGYPLFQLLGKAFQTLLPFSSISYRTNVLSALTASLLLVFIYKILESRDRWAALAIAVFLGTRPIFVEQARVAEVFMLNALFLVAILWMLSREEPNWHVLAAFVFGLGLGNHQTLLIAAPFFLMRWDARKVPLQIGFFLLGLGIYVYLPIRAFANPPVDFGDPQTWHRFWGVVTRREFGSLSLHPAALPFRDGKLLIEQATRFFQRVLAQTGAAGLAMAAFGIVAAFLRPDRRRWALAGLFFWLALGLGFEVYSNLSPFSDIGQWRLDRFYLIPLIGSVFLAALALERLRWLGLILLLDAGAVAAMQPSFRDNLIFRDFADSALRSAPAGSRIVIDRVLFDEPTSSLLVRTVVDGKRPDAAFYYRPGTLFSPVYGEDLLDLDWSGRFERQRQVEGTLANSPAPLRYLGFEKATAPFPNPSLEGLLYAPAGAPKNLDPFMVWRPAVSFDYASRLMSAHFPYFFGKAALDAGRLDAAWRWFNGAMGVGGRMTWLYSNIGGLYARADLLEEASAAFERAVASDPYFPEAQFGVGFIALKRNDPKKAVTAYDAVVRSAPNHADAQYMLGVAAQQAGDLQKAAASWHRYLALEPRGKMAAAVTEELNKMRRN